MLKTMENDCAKDSYVKTLTNDDIANVWDPEIKKVYKNILKNIFVKNGSKDEQATILADCTAYYLMRQNITLADLQDPAFMDTILNTGKMCEEIIKNKQK